MGTLRNSDSGISPRLTTRRPEWEAVTHSLFLTQQFWLYEALPVFHFFSGAINDTVLGDLLDVLIKGLA